MTARNQAPHTHTMKILAASFIAATAILTFSSCKTVIVEPKTTPTVHTTTTEETTTRHPHGGVTTETEVRRY